MSTYFTSSNLNANQRKAVVKAIEKYDTFDYKGAIEILESVTQNIDDAVAYATLGNCYLKMGDFAKAKNNFENAIKIPTLNPFPFISYGNMYYEEGNISKAILLWTVANTLVGDDASLLLNLATVYSQKDYRIQSVAYFEKYLRVLNDKKSQNHKKISSIIAKMRTSSAQFNGLAANYLNSKKLSSAIENYSKSVLNFPLQPQIYSLLGNLYFMKKDYEFSIESYLNAYITSDFNISTLGYLPLAYENMGKHSHAYAFYYIILSGAGKKSFKPNELKSKLLKNSLVVFRNDESSGIHYDIAKEYEEDNNYLLAYVEYTNSLILAKGDKKHIESARSKMLDFINPELRVVSNLRAEIDNLFEKKKYEKVINLCDKILLLLPKRSSIEELIRKKRRECQELLTQSENS